ncbi:MAG: VCBS repeat-containing protein [Wenzhouxiangellaceae bacterium]
MHLRTRNPMAASVCLLLCCTFMIRAQNPDSASRHSDWYEDVTATHLPAGVTDGLSMDARTLDADADGDLDIIIANEHRANILLLNDGSGRFSDASAARLPRGEHDSEDIGIADFDGDGDLDIVVVSEDDQTNELYLNDGRGFFSDASQRLPVTGTSNAVLVMDLTGNGHPDILIGNNGQNVLLENDGAANFTDVTSARLPSFADVTQDVVAGDANSDGHIDLLFGNEDANRLLLNNGQGVFVHASEALPLRTAAEETREADFGDIDGDGDLDILFANVQAFVDDADAQNRLLRNDGTGRFSDITASHLPPDQDRSFDGSLLDLDGDGDLDIITCNANRGSESWIAATPWRAYRNDGDGRFADATSELLPATAIGRGFDVQQADFNGDGLPDLYLSSRDGTDRLLYGIAR